MAQINKDKKVYYYQNDLIGLPQELSSVNGTIVWSAGYDAFGKDTVDEKSYVTNPLRFQGQYYDEEIGLSYNRFRYFDPEICAFASQDPLRLDAGLNLYRYAPCVWSGFDPLGLDCSFRMQPYRYGDVRVKGPHGDVLNRSGLKVTEACLDLVDDKLVWKRFGDMGKATPKDLKEADKLIRNLASDPAVMRQAENQVDQAIGDLTRDLTSKNKNTREMAERLLPKFERMKELF